MPNALKLRYSPDLPHPPVEFSQEDPSLALAATALWADVKRKGLEPHIAELEVLGYTVGRRRRRRPGVRQGAAGRGAGGL